MSNMAVLSACLKVYKGAVDLMKENALLTWASVIGPTTHVLFNEERRRGQSIRP